MDVSSKIKSLRTERGWSQEQMAEKLGVSRQAITKWETVVDADLSIEVAGTRVELTVDIVTAG